MNCSKYCQKYILVKILLSTKSFLSISYYCSILYLSSCQFIEITKSNYNLILINTIM